MRCIIDSHVLLWQFLGDKRLRREVVEVIEDSDNRIWVSSVSLWEIAIKLSLNKLELFSSFGDLCDFTRSRAIVELPFGQDDLETMMSLPYHHRDPFDRLIISQAIRRDFTIITDDNKFKSYPVKLL